MTKSRQATDSGLVQDTEGLSDDDYRDSIESSNEDERAQEVTRIPNSSTTR